MSYKILFISSEFPPGPGGIGNQGFNLVKQLNNNGYPTDVLTKAEYVSDDEINSFIKESDFKIIRFKSYSNKISTIFQRVYLIIRVLKKNKYNLIICSGQFSLWIGFFIKAFNKKYKSIAITHGGEINSSNKLIKKITDLSLGSFDAIVSVSRFTQMKLSSDILKKQQKLRIIPNGINPSEFNIHISSKKSTNQLPKLLTVGAIWERKGQQNVVKALPEIKKRFPTVHYHCVGYKIQEKNLINIARQLNVIEDITLYGNVERHILENFYKDADIFLMLSTNTKSGDFEGFGIAVLEANIFGKPAIGSRNSGINDAIVDGQTGYLVDPNSPEEISQAIEKTMKNYEYLSKNAVAFAKEHSWEKVGKKYIQLIEEVV